MRGFNEGSGQGMEHQTYDGNFVGSSSGSGLEIMRTYYYSLTQYW